MIINLRTITTLPLPPTQVVMAVVVVVVVGGSGDGLVVEASVVVLGVMV